jgi:hypothetical protein
MEYTGWCQNDFSAQRWHHLVDKELRDVRGRVRAVLDLRQK